MGNSINFRMAALTGAHQVNGVQKTGRTASTESTHMSSMNRTAGDAFIGGKKASPFYMATMNHFMSRWTSGTQILDNMVAGDGFVAFDTNK